MVRLAALDLRWRADHRSEMRSQLLLGERVDVARHSADGLWALVRNAADGYSGWVRRWGLIEVSAPRACDWAARATLRVSAPIASLRARPGSGIGVGPVFFNSRLIPHRASRGSVQVELPDGRRGWLDQTQVAGPDDRPPRLSDRLLSLLGTPYLWGGRTPAGYDCSGLTQQVLAEQGMALPRDAHQQFEWCREAGYPTEPSPGALFFFGPPRGDIQHVGIGLSSGLFAESSGTVRLTSLDRGNPLFSNGLRKLLRGVFAPAVVRLMGPYEPGGCRE